MKHVFKCAKPKHDRPCGIVVERERERQRVGESRIKHKPTVDIPQFHRLWGVALRT